MAGSQCHLTPAPLKYEERKLIQMHPCPSQGYVLFAFYWRKIHSRQGVVVETCQWYEMHSHAKQAPSGCVPLASRDWWSGWFLRQPESARTPLNISVLAASLGRCASLWEGWIQSTAGKCTYEGTLLHTLSYWRVLRACSSWWADTRYLTQFRTWQWFAVSEHAQA